MTSLPTDWEFEDRMKWKEDVHGLLGLRGRTGVKRAGNEFNQ